MIEAITVLNERGFRTKGYISGTGKVLESRLWVAKQLHRVLTQPLYRGMLHHDGTLYPAEHQAIVDDELWDQVQKKLRENQPGAGDGGENDNVPLRKTKVVHPLRGFIQTIEGFALTPTYTHTKSKTDGTIRKRYRYYVSQEAIRRGYGGLAIRTLSADLLEEAVRQMLAKALVATQPIIEVKEFTGDQVRTRLHAQSQRIGGLTSPHDLMPLMRMLRPQIVVGESSIQIHLFHDGLAKLVRSTLPAQGAAPVTSQLSVEVEMKDGCAVLLAKVTLENTRGQTRIFDVTSGEIVRVATTEPSPSLIQAVVQGEFWRRKLIENPESSLEEILAPYGLKSEYVRRLLNVGYLAPDIKQAVMQGVHPSGLKVMDLLTMRAMDWQEQRRELGFPSESPVASVARGKSA